MEPKNIQEVQQQIQETLRKRATLTESISVTEANLRSLENKYSKKTSGFFDSLFTSNQTITNLRIEVQETKKQVEILHEELNALKVNIDQLSYEVDDTEYRNLLTVFEELSKCNKIWRVTAQKAITDAKSYAKTDIERKAVSFSSIDLPFIDSKFKALVLPASDGGSLFLYPNFILQSTTEAYGVLLTDIKKISFTFGPQRCLETKEAIPPDSKIVDQTWLKVNKDGTPDRRFVGNLQIPIVRYGYYHFSSPGRFDVTYNISNYELSEAFAFLFKRHINPSTASSTPSNILEANNDEVTRQYYHLLAEFSSQLKALINRFKKDTLLSQGLAESAGKEIPPQFIPYCFVFDFCKITRILTKENYKKEALEMFGLVFCVSKILPLSVSDVLDSNYESVSNLYSTGIYTTVAESVFINIGKNDNPIKLEKNVLSDRGISADDHLKNGLSFPIYLKLIDHPLFDEYAAMLYHFANIISKADNKITSTEEKKLKYIYQITHHPIPETVKQTLIVENQKESIEDIVKQLDSLIGLEAVKQEIKTLINFINVQKARAASGLKSSNISYHIVFTGNPGTGKTTVARIAAKVYRALGILTQGQLVETDRSGLIAEYVGQTAPRVNKTVDSALNGVLFIDEAYSIAGESQNDYGKEAIATLIKRMEDDREKLVVIIAGYPKEMGTFVETNPGLKSRFNRYIDFPDYNPNELYSIFESNCKNLEYKISNEAKSKLVAVFESAYSTRDRSFGNGRFVRNIFEKTLERQANRIASIPSLSKEILTAIIEEDIPIR